MNILFFLRPKPIIKYLNYDDSLREALYVMKQSGYTNLPVINKAGEFVFTLSETDILYKILEEDNFSLKNSEKIKINTLKRIKEYKTISINNNIEDLFNIAIEQNYVPVVDDRNKFIGIVTRRDILKHFKNV